MERSKQAPLVMWALLAGLLSQNFVIPVISTSFEDQKNYYSPDPHAGSPPTGSHGSPPYGTSPPSYGTPSHGSGGSYGSTPPSHGTPSHGSGGSYGSTPPSHGSGGSCTPTPSHGSGGTTHDPTTPSTPSGGGGGYYHSPPTSSGSPPLILSPPTSGTPSVPTPPFAFDPNTPPWVIFALGVRSGQGIAALAMDPRSSPFYTIPRCNSSSYSSWKSNQQEN